MRHASISVVGGRRAVVLDVVDLAGRRVKVTDLRKRSRLMITVAHANTRIAIQKLVLSHQYVIATAR